MCYYLSLNVNDKMIEWHSDANHPQEFFQTNLLIQEFLKQISISCSDKKYTSRPLPRSFQAEHFQPKSQATSFLGCLSRPFWPQRLWNISNCD